MKVMMTEQKDLKHKEMLTGREKQCQDMPSVLHSLVSKGPIYTCRRCNQLWYRHSAILAETLKSSNNNLGKYTLDKKSFDNQEWLCNSCHKYLKEE